MSIVNMIDDYNEVCPKSIFYKKFIIYLRTL